MQNRTESELGDHRLPDLAKLINLTVLLDFRFKAYYSLHGE